MKNKIHLIMPMGGRGSRFSKDGFEMPKPLIEINNLPFLYWSTKSISLYVDVEDIIFVVLQEHIDNFNIDKEIKKYFPDAKIVILSDVLNGALLTAMKGLEVVDDDLPILFNDCDHMFKSSDFNNFCFQKNFDEIDGALLTFKSDSPKYSYIRLNDNDDVIETKEKEVISSHAICGAYYFKNKIVFLKNASEYLNNCKYSEFYISGVYNVMIKNGLKIKHFNTDYHIPFGTPEEYDDAIKLNIFKDLP